jgi:hypothetical protein
MVCLLGGSTFLGGTDDDQANGIAADGAGNSYVVGSTGSSSFPTITGVFQATKGLSDDAFLVKIGPDGGSTPTPTVTPINTPSVTPTATPTLSPGVTPLPFYLPFVDR